MALELGLSDAGLVVPRTADYLTEIQDRYEALTGLTVDWDNDLVVGILSSIMAQLLDQQAEALQAVYDAFDVNNASGVQLANLARIVGVNVKSATHALVTLTCTGDVGTAITVGKLAEGGGDDGRARWTAIEDALIPAAGSVDVQFQSEVAGRTTAGVGEIDTIVTPTPGWLTVTNAEPASPGTDAETDTDLRIRRAQSIQLSAGLGIGAIRAKVLALDFIEAAAVIDNPDNEDKLVEGLFMWAHTYLLIVLPGALTVAQKAEVLQLLYDNTPVSVGHSATDVVAGVVGEDGFVKSVGFDFATLIPVDIVATLTMSPGYSIADAGPALQTLVSDHIDQLQIGDPLLQLKLCALADQVPGVIGASFTINGLVDLDPTAIEQLTTVGGGWSVVSA